MVCDGGFERDETLCMVVDVHTDVAKLSMEGINLCQEAILHFGHQIRMAFLQLGKRGHQFGMAFLHFTEAVIQLGNQRINSNNNRIQLLILPTKDSTTSKAVMITAL